MKQLASIALVVAALLSVSSFALNRDQPYPCESLELDRLYYPETRDEISRDCFDSAEFVALVFNGPLQDPWEPRLVADQAHLIECSIARHSDLTTEQQQTIAIAWAGEHFSVLLAHAAPCWELTPEPQAEVYERLLERSGDAGIDLIDPFAGETPNSRLIETASSAVAVDLRPSPTGSVETIVITIPSERNTTAEDLDTIRFIIDSLELADVQSEELFDLVTSRSIGSIGNKTVCYQPRLDDARITIGSHLNCGIVLWG